jgi:gamma-glutamylcyclotransferase
MYYFAYGSNLHPLRLGARVPSARLIATTSLSGHRLSFNKRGADGSSKCNLTPSEGTDDRVYGAIYSVDPAHKRLLDRHEGLGDGYTDHSVELEHEGQCYACFTYVAQESHIEEALAPFHWYKDLVLLGADYLDFPASYREGLAATDSVDDEEVARAQLMAGLIAQMREPEESEGEAPGAEPPG